MDPLGIMLYGYTKTDSQLIQSLLESIFNTPIILLSGSFRESDTVETIISDEAYDRFDDKELKVLLFLGFNDTQISLTLEKFYNAQVTRPIFCTLTENNSQWPLHQLLEHLEEERDYWNKKENKES